MKPKKDSGLNKMEIFNEQVTKMAEFFMICFTDFVPDPEIKQSIVKPFVGLVSFCIFVNLVYLMKKVVLQPLKKKC